MLNYGNEVIFTLFFQKNIVMFVVKDDLLSLLFFNLLVI